MTGISNIFGTWEEELIRNDDLRQQIDEQLRAVFGSDQLWQKQIVMMCQVIQILVIWILVTVRYWISVAILSVLSPRENGQAS